MKALSGMDNLFLHMEHGNQYMHVASLGIYDQTTAPGGSVRNPSTMCGVTGIKPTYGLVSRRGVFPLALTSELFRKVHPWVPFSWVVRSARAALFGAYDGAWVSALAVLALFGVASIAITAMTRLAPG